MWSNRSRRQLSIHRSATPFFQRLSNEVWLASSSGIEPLPGLQLRTCHPDQRNRVADSNGNASLQDPEELVEYRERWSGMPSFQSYELLAKNKVFKKRASPRPEEPKNSAREDPEGVFHVGLLSRLACGTQRCDLLKSQADRILASTPLH